MRRANAAIAAMAMTIAVWVPSPTALAGTESAVPGSNPPWSAVPGSARDKPAAREQTVRDDLGREIALWPRPMRIATLAPHATELAFAAGLAAQVIAVDPASDAPPMVAGLPRIAALPEPDHEALVRLAPDLVVIWGAGMRAGVIERLQRRGIRVFVSEPRRLDDIAASIERLGRFAADPAPARLAAAALRGEIREIAVRASRDAVREPVRVFYQVWTRPLMTVSDRDLIGDAIATCGAVNVFSTAPTAAFVVDREAVLARRPQLIVVADRPGATAVWDDALASGRVQRSVHLAPTLLQRPSPSIVDGLRRLCTAIAATRHASGR